MYIFASLFHPFTQTAGLRLSPGFRRGSFGARVLLRRPELSPSRLNSQLGPWFFGTRVRCRRYKLSEESSLIACRRFIAELP